MMNKFGFQAIVLLSVMHGTTISMMYSRKIMSGTSRLTLNKSNSRTYFEDIPFLEHKAISPDPLKELKINLKERDKHYTWQIANEVAKMRVKFEILAANLPHHQELRMLEEADKIVIKKE
jgi:hypothetical protein